MKKLFSILLYLVFAGTARSAAQDQAALGEVSQFALIDQKGTLVQKKDLLGKVWVANFIFTRCEGPCPVLTSRLAALQDKIPSDALMVSFSVDPEFDSPPVLDYYAKDHGAKSDRWLFLTGSPKGVSQLLANGFRLAFDAGDAENPGTTLIHSTKFVIVDANGKIRRYVDGENPEDVRKIPLAMKQLTLERDAPWAVKLPLVNAGLNFTSAVLLLLGYQLIRARKVTGHRICMGGAFLVSIIFLISYVAYHHAAGSVGYGGEGWIRKVYFAILISHSLLAALIVPLASTTLYFAMKNNFDRHKKIARWTLPIWLYVSVTGVVIYAMLYR